MSKLQTASIAADMAAADVNGTVTYAGLETRLTDLNSKLSSSKTTLTSAELSDLETIVANLDNGMSTSAYLTNVMNSLVNGNAANATWSGGNAHRRRLATLPSAHLPPSSPSRSTSGCSELVFRARRSASAAPNITPPATPCRHLLPGYQQHPKKAPSVAARAT